MRQTILTQASLQQTGEADLFDPCDGHVPLNQDDLENRTLRRG